jgi:hypothetical protein
MKVLGLIRPCMFNRTVMKLWVIQRFGREDPTHTYSVSVTQILCNRLKSIRYGYVKYAASKPAGPDIALLVGRTEVKQ